VHTPKVSVIIPCRNEKVYIENCVNAILSNDFDATSIEVIIVDGFSDDGTRTIIKDKILKNPSVKLIDNPAKKTPHAFNLGIENSTGEYIIIVGARCVISVNYIRTCIDILYKDTSIGCVGGRVENIYENKRSKLIAYAMSSPFGVGGGNFRIKNKDGFVDTVGTPAYRKSIFSEIGLFDIQLVRNQDDELNYRLIKNGYKIYFTVKTSLSYYVRADYKKLFRQYYQYGYWKIFINKKHKTITTVRQLVPLIFLLYLTGGIVLSLFSKWIFFTFSALWLVYIIMGVYSAFQVSRILRYIPEIIYAFFILHISYGYGYFIGFIRFIVLGKKPHKSSEKLSR